MSDDDDVTTEALTSPVPMAIEAERAVLGAMMHNPRIVDEVLDVITGDDFYRPAHEVVFNAIVQVMEHGDNRAADPVTVLAQLQRTGQVKAFGGNEGPFLHDLYSSVQNVLSASWYAQEVRAMAIRRRLADTGRRITQFGQTPNIDPAEAVELAEVELGQVNAVNNADAAQPIGPSFYELLESLEHPEPEATGVPTGFPDLDRKLGKLRNGQLVIVGARPRIGKSVLLGDIARHASINHGVPSLFLSLEMSRKEIISRWVAATSRVDLARVIGHTLDDRDWDLVRGASRKIAEAPLYLEASGGMNLAGIRSRVRSAIRRHGVRIVFIDYLQLVSTNGGHDRREAVDALTRGLKLLAQSVNIPIVVAAQLNRAAADRPPQLADFREAGEIENSADVALLLDRPDVREMEHDPLCEPERPGEIDVIVAKNRNGESGPVTLLFEGHYTRCSSLVRWPEPRTDKTTDITEPLSQQDTA